MSSARAFALVVLLAGTAVPAQLVAEDAPLDGDAAWLRRVEGHDGRGRAHLESARRAIRASEREREADPDALDPHWKLIRALHFAGEFATRDKADKRMFFERAVEASEQAFEVLAHHLGDAEPLASDPPEALGARFAPADRPAVARIHFWAGLAWGSRASVRGPVATIREGVIDRLYRCARVTVAIEPEFEWGGAHRLLGRLHATVPRIPLLTGWVDREQALPELEKALAIAPELPGNRLLYAITLLDLAPTRRAEALALLGGVARLEPDPNRIVEHLSVRKAARERLAAEES